MPLSALAAALLTLMSACGPAPHSASTTQPVAIPNEAELSSQPSLAEAWADRLRSDDPSVSAGASRTLVEGGARSVPLLRQLVRSRDERVRSRAIGVTGQLGPDALGLLVEMLGDRRVSVRRAAIDLLVDLAPETESIQPALQRALADEDAMVARDAARALGALGDRVAPSTTAALTDALSHADPHVRLYAAEALASIGPAAAPATPRLIALLDDSLPGVRWAACEALASIGPVAADAVPRLIELLRDDSLYVRICAAGALGSIGPKAAAAADALKTVAEDSNLHAEASWALGRITGETAPAQARYVPSTMTSRPTSASTASASAIGNSPTDWDVKTGRNIAWSAELGGDTMGRPVVADGVVYLGTDNSRKLDPAFTDPCGVLMAFRVTDGAFLWQDLAPRVAHRGTGQFLLPSTTSAPYIDGDRLYYVTAECQLRCLDARSGRAMWEVDMCAKLGVFPHEASNSDVLPIGDLLIVCTSNGRNEGHTRVPSPRAPSLIAVDRHTGDVVWRAVGAGEHILHGEWCSPVAIGTPGGPTQVLFGGGDGWLRAYDAGTGREIWRFDGNPKDAQRRPRPGVFSRNPIIASPVHEDGRVFIAMGDDPSHGNGPSLVHAISPNGHGDVTESRRLWTSREVGRVVGTPVVKDGLLYLGDLGGTVTCLDAATGALVWRHETEAAIWGCLTLVGDKLYVGNVDGVMTVLRAGRRKDVLARIEMDASLYARPAVVGDALYLATARRLYLISAKP